MELWCFWGVHDRVIHPSLATILNYETEFLSYLLMGATLQEAVGPYLRDAVNAALAPNIATMTTIGIVSLPGMMTGQTLGGSIPLVAIKYQIAIMLGIFISLILSSVLNVYLSLPVAFNEYDLLREDVFRDSARINYPI